MKRLKRTHNFINGEVWNFLIALVFQTYSQNSHIWVFGQRSLIFLSLPVFYFKGANFKSDIEPKCIEPKNITAKNIEPKYPNLGILGQKVSTF